MEKNDLINQILQIFEDNFNQLFICYKIQKISEDLKRESQENFQHQEQMLEILLKNYIELIQLADALKKIRIHQELRSEYSFSRDAPPFSLEKYLRYYKLQRVFDNLDPEIRTQLKISLLNDAHLILKDPLNSYLIFNKLYYFQYSDNLNGAFDELRQRQISKKMEFVDKIENVLQNQNNSFIKKQSQPRSQNIQKTTRSMSAQKKSAQNKSSGSMMRSNSHKKIGNTNVSNQENIDHSFNKNLITNQSNNTFNNTHLSAMSNGSQSKKAQNSNQKAQLQMSSQSFYSNSRINNSLNSMNKFTKQTEFANHPSNCLKLRNSDKDTLICQLSETLNLKIAELVKLEDTNQRLRVEINDQCKQADMINMELQNQIKFREDQVKNCQNQMKGMDQNLKDTKQQMNVLLFKNQEIEKHKNNLEKAEKVIQSFNNALKYQELLDEKESFSRDYYKRKILQFGFNSLVYATIQSKRINHLTEINNKNFLKTYGAYMFNSWKRFTENSKRIKHAQAVLDNQISTTFFKQWAENVIFSKNLKIFKERQRLRTQVEAYCQIKDFQRLSRRFKQQDAFAVKYYQKKLKRKSLNQIKQFFQTYNHTKKDFIVQTRKALNHYQLQKKAISFKIWSNWFRKWVIPMRERKRKSQNHFNSIIIAKAFQRWTVIRQIRQQNEAKAELGNIRRQKKFMQKLIWKWRDSYHEIYIRKKTLNNRIGFQVKQKYFKIWQSSRTKKENNVIQKQIIDQKNNQKLILKTIKSLKMNVSANKKLEKKILKLKQQRNQKRIRKIFQAFKTSLQQQKIENKKIKQIQLKTQQKFFNVLQKKSKRQINRKEKKTALKSQQLFKQKQNFQKAFIQWKLFTSRSKRNKRLLQKADEHHLQKVFLHLVLGIKDQNIQIFKRRSIEQQLMIKSLEDRCTQSICYANEADQKQIDFINKMDLLSQNIDFLKSEIAEKNAFIDSLKQNIAQKNDSIENLTTELMITQTENKEISKKLSHLDNELVNKVQKYEQTISDLKDQYAILNNSVLQMQYDFELKERGYKEQYGALSIKNASQDNYIAKLEQIKVDLEQKYAESEAYSSKQYTENKDLLLIVQNFDEERDQYKYKIDECLKLIEENSSMYEQKLVELKEIRNDLETDNIVLKEKNIRQENEIIDLKNDLKKLEYQVEIMVAEQHKQTLQFIDNLNHNTNMNKFATISTINKYKSNQYDILQDNLEQQLYTPIQTMSPNMESQIRDSATLQNYVAKRATDEIQVQQRVVSIQEFLRPKRQEVSPLKSYLTNRKERSQEKKNEHAYVLPQVQSQRSNRITLTSPTRLEARIDIPSNYNTKPSIQQTQFVNQKEYHLPYQYNKYESSNTPSKNLTIDSIQKEVRTMKANTTSLKQNIERRLQSLNQNLDTDIIDIKQQRLTSLNEENVESYTSNY